MTDEDVATVLEAMGWSRLDNGPWWCSGEDQEDGIHHDDMRVDDDEDEGTIDANFIVETVIPWAEPNHDIHVWPSKGGWACQGFSTGKAFYGRAPTFPGAVMAALAAAIRAKVKA